MPALVYRATRPSDFAPTVTIEDFTLIYHRPSGNTHLLAEPAPEILAALGEGPATPADILLRLERNYGVDRGDGAEMVIAARMAELSGLGLIQAA